MHVMQNALTSFNSQVLSYIVAVCVFVCLCVCVFVCVYVCVCVCDVTCYWEPQDSKITGYMDGNGKKFASSLLTVPCNKIGLLLPLIMIVCSFYVYFVYISIECAIISIDTRSLSIISCSYSQSLYVSRCDYICSTAKGNILVIC